MEAHTLKRMNRSLKDHLGSNLYGDPLYKWLHTSDEALRYPLRVSESMVQLNGILRPVARYEWQRQIEDERWVVASWSEPPSYDEWLSMFGSEIGWPRRGLYYSTDIMLKLGIEPNDAATNDVIGKVKAQRRLTYRDFLDHANAKAEHASNEALRQQHDLIDDAVTAFGNIPGKRGGSVSFGGI